MVGRSRRARLVRQRILDGKTWRAIGAQPQRCHGTVVRARRRLDAMIRAHGGVKGWRSAVAVDSLEGTPSRTRGTRAEDPRQNQACLSGTAHERGAAIAICVKTMELLLAGMRRYAKASMTTELLRLVVEYCAGLI